MNPNITSTDLIAQIVATRPFRWQASSLAKQGFMVKVNNVYEWDIERLKELQGSKTVLESILQQAKSIL